MSELCKFTRIRDLNEWHCSVCRFIAFTDALPERPCDLKPIHSDPRQRRRSRAATPSAAMQPRDPMDSENQYLKIIQPCEHRGEVIETQVPCEACGQKGQLYNIYKCDIHGQCSLGQRRIAGDNSVRACISCTDGPNVKLANQTESPMPPAPQPTTDSRQPTTPHMVIPGAGGWQAWRGISNPKPWQYEVTAIIPVINPDDTLPLVIELLRLQTERPYILLIDTGSPESSRPFLESLRASDVEVHYIRKHGNVHLAECVSQACDLGAALALTRFTFFTHADCFLRKRTALAEAKALAARHIVAGHQITERAYDNWDKEFGHTFVIVDQDEIDRRGITWKMRRGAITPGVLPDGVCDYSAELLMELDPPLEHWIDTERSFNRLLMAAGIPGYFTGGEKNWQRNTDEWIDHVRSIPGSKMYGEDYYKQASEWLPAAIAEARERIAAWQAADYKPTVSIITTCKGRLIHLRETLPGFLQQAADEVIVVDYDCPDHVADNIEKGGFAPAHLKTVRVRNDAQYFNQARARNAGANVATGDILLFLDADIIAPPDFTDRIVQRLIDEQADLVNPSHQGNVHGSCAVRRSAWREVRGFDEDMTGYGGEDIDFYARVTRAGLKQVLMEDNRLSAIAHGDEDRTRFHAEKDRHAASRLNNARAQDIGRQINPNGFGAL